MDVLSVTKKIYKQYKSRRSECVDKRKKNVIAYIFIMHCSCSLFTPHILHLEKGTLHNIAIKFHHDFTPRVLSPAFLSFFCIYLYASSYISFFYFLKEKKSSVPAFQWFSQTFSSFHLTRKLSTQLTWHFCLVFSPLFRLSFLSDFFFFFFSFPNNQISMWSAAHTFILLFVSFFSSSSIFFLYLSSALMTYLLLLLSPPSHRHTSFP